MAKKSTWLFLILLLLITGILVILEYRPESTPDVTDTPVVIDYLFSESDGALIIMRIYDNDYNIVEITRPAGGLWEMTLPEPGQVDQALAEAGATQVGALRIVNEIERPQTLSSYGLLFPEYVIKLTFDQSGKHVMEIGDETPSGSGYYVQIDDEKIFIVSEDGIEAVINLLRNPPYLPATATLAPEQQSTNTPTP